MQRFGEKLRTLRMKHGMTVRELAHALGYTAHSHVGEVETGRQKPSIEFALKVSRLFNVTMDQLTKDELEVDETSIPESEE
jgi:transcriptional regulator with XRE-family HTH domain